MAVGRTSVGIEGMDVSVTVGGEAVEVDKISTEKVQAFSNSVANMQPMIGRINRNPLRCFIAFSLSAMYDMS